MRLTLYSTKERIIIVFIILWLSVFLFILRSQTGLVVFCLLVIFFLLRYLFTSKNLSVKFAILSLSILVMGFFLYTFNKAYCEFYSVKDDTILEKRTANGRNYIHNNKDIRYENGYTIWNYYCEEEIKKEWNNRSKINFDSTDKKGNTLKYTLTRYMTSKGLRKDSCGISSLSENDIQAIENGYPNYIYIKRFSLYSFLYKQIWIIDSYIKGDDPSGHSLTQRLEYFKAASCIIYNNFFFGTGTGDVQNSYTNYYSTFETQLDPQRQLRAHNQWLTFFLTFGLIGFILSLLAIILPVIKSKLYKNFMFIIPFIISIISFLNEDTLETQAGVTFFAFFYVFFLVNNKKPR